MVFTSTRNPAIVIYVGTLSVKKYHFQVVFTARSRQCGAIEWLYIVVFQFRILVHVIYAKCHYFREPLNHIHQDTKWTRLIAVIPLFCLKFKDIVLYRRNAVFCGSAMHYQNITVFRKLKNTRDLHATLVFFNFSYAVITRYSHPLIMLFIS